MRKFRLMLGMLAVLAGVFAAAYWIHPVDLADEIFVQNQGKALLWSVVANVVLGIALLLWVSLRQEWHTVLVSEKEPDRRKKILQAPWFGWVCLLGMAIVLFLLFPVVTVFDDPFHLREPALLFLIFGIVWARMLTVYDDFPEASFKRKLLEAVKPGVDLKNICRILLLADLFCIWLGLTSKGITGLWMLYNPLYLIPALVALYFCLNNMKYFNLVFIWFLIFPSLAVILDNVNCSQSPVLVETSIEVPNIK